MIETIFIRLRRNRQQLFSLFPPFIRGDSFAASGLIGTRGAFCEHRADSNFSLVEPWNVVDLIEKPLPTAPCWIEPAVLPKGAKMLFGGHAKIGKSFVMLELARSLALGKQPFAAPALRVPSPTKVLLLEQELGRLLEAGVPNL